MKLLNNTAPTSRCKRCALHLDSVCDRVACSAVRDFVRNCCNYAKVSLRLIQRARVDFLTSAPAYVKNQPRNLKPRSFLLWSVFPLSSLALSPFPLSLKLMYAILMRERQGGQPFTAVLS